MAQGVAQRSLCNKFVLPYGSYCVILNRIEKSHLLIFAMVPENFIDCRCGKKKKQVEEKPNGGKK